MRLAATLLWVSAALSAGCADNQETLIVLSAPAWDESGDCVVNSNAEDALLFGVLDLSFRSPYLMPAVLLNNSAAQPVNDNNTGVVSNEIQIIDAEVSLDSPQDPDLLKMIDDDLKHFTAALSTNSIQPGETVGVAVEVIPQGTVNAFADHFAGMPAGAKVTVRANVVFNATRSNNDVGKVGQIKARDFSFPIELCDGCLLYCGGCTDDNGDPSDCPMQGGSFAGGVCGNAQDLQVWPASCKGPSN